MSKLKTVSKSTRVRQEATTANLNVSYNYEHEQGVTPEMIVAKGRPIVQDESKEAPPTLVIDLIYYPKSQNIQVTIHNAPADFDATLINEVLDPIEEVLKGV